MAKRYHLENAKSVDSPMVAGLHLGQEYLLRTSTCVAATNQTFICLLALDRVKQDQETSELKPDEGDGTEKRTPQDKRPIS
jgi:hypothetical protein